MNYLIRDLNTDEKPREKLLKFGQINLTETELLALIIRSGGKNISALELARKILANFGGMMGLAKVDIGQLLKIKHIDIAKASAIIAALEVGLRIQNQATDNSKSIQKPEDIVNIIKHDLAHKQKEHLYLLSLNSRNKLIAKDLVSIGTISETLLSPREIFRQALIRNASGIILVHNHPSNDPTPSSEDIDATQKVYKLSTELMIPLVDHLIITDTDFVSLNKLKLLVGKTYKKGGDKN